jgi:hypothetical protein
MKRRRPAKPRKAIPMTPLTSKRAEGFMRKLSAPDEPVS